VLVSAPPPPAALVALAPRVITPPPDAPAATGPRVVLLAPILGNGRALVRWRAALGAGTFDVAVRPAGRAWRTVAARILRRRYLVRGAPGARLDVRVRARAFSGLPGVWSAPQRIVFRASRSSR